MKKFWFGSLLFAILSGCVEEDIRRLQTDQSFEGKEAYLISSLLDEHLFLLWQPVSFFADSTKIAEIPGCPEITLDSAKNEVTVNFDGVDCADISGSRSGKLLFNYAPMPTNQRYTLVVSYMDYTYQDNKFTGTRVLNLIAQHGDKRIFSDASANFSINAENMSSTRINFTLSHEVSIAEGQITQGKSTGSGTGRNWVGREVKWEITVPKLFPLDCPGRSRSRPNLGQEMWTITRSSTSDVIHSLTFYSESECNTHTIIQLDEGVEMKKAP